MLCLVAQSCLPVGKPMDYSPPGSSVHGDSPGKNIEVSCLLQGIFPTQGSNLGLLHCRQILYQLRYQGSPDPKDIHALILRICECVKLNGKGTLEM